MLRTLAAAVVVGSIGLASTASPVRAGNPCNPCAGKMANPCNPCSSKKKGMDPSLVRKPAGVQVSAGDWKAGKKLWNDPSLGRSGAACATCHVGNYTMMKPYFGTPYPHHVDMAWQKFGLDRVSAAEMVQLCMVVPMQARPLDWKGKKLADLTAYVQHIQKAYKPPANPCSGKMANPCNPCAGKMKNPCSR